MAFSLFPEERPTTLFGRLSRMALDVCSVRVVAEELNAKLVWDDDGVDRVYRISTEGNESALVFKKVSKDFASICRLFTKRKHRRKGFSDLLMQKFLTVCDSNKVNVRLFCQPFQISEAEEEDFFTYDLLSFGPIIPDDDQQDWMLDNYQRWGFELVPSDERNKMERKKF